MSYNPHYSTCDACRLIFFDTVPDADQIRISCEGKSIFKRLRRRLIGRFRKLSSLTHLTECRDRARHNLALLRNHVDAAKVAYLDIGCNKGFLVEAAMEAGWEAWGVEYAEEQIRPFLNTYPKHRARVFAGDFLVCSPKLPSAHFDLVSALDVIEHFPDPVAYVAQIARILKPGGAFVVQTPDINSKQAHDDGPKWGELMPVDHLQLFGIESLERLARATGFSSVRLEPTLFMGPASNLAATFRR